MQSWSVAWCYGLACSGAARSGAVITGWAVLGRIQRSGGRGGVWQDTLRQRARFQQTEMGVQAVTGDD